MNFDIIGDIHRHSDALIAQLKLMGYRKRNGAWKHPERSAIFVGDFIDRGPNQIEIVDIVRRMVDAGNVMAVMGNHELNGGACSCDLMVNFYAIMHKPEIQLN